MKSHWNVWRDADYHYFGSIPFKKKGKLGVNNNCQLLENRNIYIVDGSVFDFKTNKYPLGLVIANARRIGKLLSKWVILEYIFTLNLSIFYYH